MKRGKTKHFIWIPSRQHSFILKQALFWYKWYKSSSKISAALNMQKFSWRVLNANNRFDKKILGGYSAFFIRELFSSGLNSTWDVMVPNVDGIWNNARQIRNLNKLVCFKGTKRDYLELKNINYKLLKQKYEKQIL